MIGFDAVTRPVLQGGRAPADRQAAVPWGERAVGLRPVERPRPGRGPGPAPCRVFPEPAVVEVRDQVGRAVAVTERGVVSGEPTRLLLDGGWQSVVAWAGPWPVDEAWWSDGPGRASRFQVVGADGRAWLLLCGSDGGRVEAGYDWWAGSGGGRLMGGGTPPISWKELERRLSGLPGADDAPVSRPKRRRLEPVEVARDPSAGHTPYAELHCHSHYSFLDGASSPAE